MPNSKVGVRQPKIWIDLDNTPHVPFFAPIMKELAKRNYSVVVTARDAFQVRELADLFHLTYRPVGRHYGRSKVLKAIGTVYRGLQLAPIALREAPDLAISHGSRAQLIAAALLRVPSVVIVDYEFARSLGALNPTWILVPEVIPDSAVKANKRKILKYPGIKEDVYVPSFVPDPAIKHQLRLNEDDLVITVRPPATEAHYHNPESEKLFEAVMDLIAEAPGARAVMLPRNAKQAALIRDTWPSLFQNGKVLIPGHAVDGLNLIWHSDLVVSGGGTMNREAAAMGVPVYSIFRGSIGAVDRYLVGQGRLILLENVDSVRSKLLMARRTKPGCAQWNRPPALQAIVQHIEAAAKGENKFSQPAGSAVHSKYAR